ncbi:Hypothetical predicted protein [Cloeon dipterum]|uniref:Peptidase M13 N-terminal domain-containing protein n=1 Tax=Cloeon dipterum TaxID=197152 RepID=A0A8S1CZI5_9INSE|nr:Hypothetical predicted protein [Cloeon dipterum]
MTYSCGWPARTDGRSLRQVVSQVSLPVHEDKGHSETSTVCIESFQRTISQDVQQVRPPARLYSSIDTSVDPCDDFYQFACGGWIEKHPVPDGASHVDQFQLLKDQSINQIREILEADNSHLTMVPLMQARSLYRRCMDEGNARRMVGLHLWAAEFL